jgi:hypothetical protein
MNDSSLLVITLIMMVCVTAATVVTLNIYINTNNTSTSNLHDTEYILNSAKMNSVIEDLIGVWEIKDKRMPIKQFTIEKVHVGIATDTETHYLGCNSCNEKPIGTASVLYKNIVFKKNNHGFDKCYTDSDMLVYKLVLHPNGVVKFVINPDLTGWCKLKMVRTDSKSWFNAGLNLIHKHKYGCFCLGILSPDGNSIQRYNRWSQRYPDIYYKIDKVAA